MRLSRSLGASDAEMVRYVDMVLGRREGSLQPQQSGHHAELALIDANIEMTGISSEDSGMARYSRAYRPSQDDGMTGDSGKAVALAVQLEWEGFRRVPCALTYVLHTDELLRAASVRGLWARAPRLLMIASPMQCHRRRHATPSST